MARNPDIDRLDPLLSESDLNNWWINTSDSEFARVVFFDIVEIYPTDGDIECRYRFSGKLKPDPNAIIGLYRIGWSLPQDYITYLSCREASIVMNDGGKEYVLLFQAVNLPKDDGEFYQFCYIDAEGQICGASIPFRFRRPLCDELLTMAPDSEDRDFVVVRSRHAVMEEKLRHTLKTTSNLKLANADLQLKLEGMQLAEKKLWQEKEDRYLMIQQLESDVRHLEETVRVLETEVTQKRSTIKEKEENCSQLQSCLDGSEGRSQQLHSTIRDMVKKQDDLMSRIRAEEERYNILQEHCKQLEAKVHQTEREKKEQHDNFTSRSTAFEHRQLLLEGQVKTLQEENKKLKDQSLQEKENWEFLLSQFENTKAMLEAQEDTKELMKRELEADKEFRNKITQLLENVQAENFMLKQKQKASETARFLEKEHIKDLNVRVTELKARLEEGAREYQRQYILRSKLERKLIKIKGSNRSSLSEMPQSASLGLVGVDNRHSVGITNSDADTGESCSGGNANPEFSEELKDNEVSLPYNRHSSCRSETEVKELLSYDAVPRTVVCAPLLAEQKVDQSMHHSCRRGEQKMVEIVQTSALRPDTSEDCTVMQDDVVQLLDVNSNSRQTRASAPPSESAGIFTAFPQILEMDEGLFHTFETDMIDLEDHADLPSIYDVPCPVCDETFAIYSEDAKPLINHLQVKHSQTPCPVCSKLFDLSLPSQYLEYHVQDHFRDDDIQVTSPIVLIS